MLLKNRYEKLLKDTVKFKKGLNTVINSIDERIDKTETDLEEAQENFSLKTHNHDDTYSKLNHTHNGTGNIAMFTVDGTSGTTSIPIKGNVSADGISFIENSEYFEVLDIVNGYAVIRYNVPQEDVEKIFSMMYVNGDVEVTPTNYISVTVPDTDEPNLRITVTVTDEENNPVEGTANITLTKI